MRNPRKKKGKSYAGTNHRHKPIKRIAGITGGGRLVSKRELENIIHEDTETFFALRREYEGGYADDYDDVDEDEVEVVAEAPSLDAAAEDKSNAHRPANR